MFEGWARVWIGMGLSAILCACNQGVEVRVSKQVTEPGAAYGGEAPSVEEMDGISEEIQDDVVQNPEGPVSEPNLFYHLAITEIFYDPVTLPDAAGEWFEISNLGKAPIPMDELEIRTPLGKTVLSMKASLLPGGIALISRFPYPSATPYGLIPDVVSAEFMLPNTKGFVEIRINDKLLDRVEYGGALGFPDPSGASLSLDNGAYSTDLNDDGANWCPGRDEYAPNEYGSPGEPNPHCDQFLVPPVGELGGTDEGGGEESSGGEEGGTTPGEEGGTTEEEGGEEGSDDWWEDDWSWSEDEGGTEEEEDEGGEQGGEGGGWEPPDWGLGSANQIVISEIQADPQSAPDEKGEWIELTNLSDWNVDLRGLTILDNASFHVIKGEQAVFLKANGTVVLARSTDMSENGGMAADYAYGGLVLNNSGDTVTLADGDNILDQVAFGEENGMPGVTGVSMSLDSGAFGVATNDDPQNWCPSSETYGWGDGGTPGILNPPCISDSGVSFPSGPYENLVITEIMYDPSAVVDTKGEWLEIYNPGPGTVDLRGLTLQDAADSHVIAAAEPLNVGSGEYVVLARNGSTAQNGGVVPIHVYGKLTLNNPGETLTLSYDGTLIDQVVYGGTEGTPEAKGASLMLFSAGKPSNTSNDSSFNWCVSAGSFGSGDKGSPGQDNGNCAN